MKHTFAAKLSQVQSFWPGGRLHRLVPTRPVSLCSIQVMRRSH
jgi:hypothetical protein